MKYIIVATQLCSDVPLYTYDIWQKVFYFGGYDSESKKVKFDERAKFALKLDRYEEAVDMLNFIRNCKITNFLNKIQQNTNYITCPYSKIVELLKDFDAKMKYEIICVGND